MTMADRQLQERVEQFQQPGVPIRVSRLIGANWRDEPAAAGPDV